MKNPYPDLELLQLGHWEVRSQALDGPGMSWDEVLEQRMPADKAVLALAPEDFPNRGWRVVDTTSADWASEVVILGAPSALYAGRWVLVQFARRGNHWLLAQPVSCLPVPPREIRRRGLRLEWTEQEFLFDKDNDKDRSVTVVLKNNSSSPWIPTEEDLSHVQAVIVDGRGKKIGNGWYAYGKSCRLPELGPGEEVMLSTLRNNAELDEIPTGDYRMVAWLTSLGLCTNNEAGLAVQ